MLPQAQAVAAQWFDGRSSRARAVRVVLEPGPRGPSLQIHDGQLALELRNGQVGWPEAWSAGRAPPKVMVDLREHGSLQIDDVPGWHAALAGAGHAAPLAQRMQTRWTVFLAVLVVAAGLLAAFYRWGTPWAATQLTRQVPMEWETSLAARALQDMDASWLHPSKLPADRQAALRSRFEAVARQIDPRLQRYPGYAPKLTLQFRSGLGPNAFALPGGTIVMTDAMVNAAAEHQLPDEALVGVLAHEIGHVLHRHTTRMVVEQGVLNVGLGLALGDISTLVSTGGSLLTGLAYRRSHETEADCFALALMRHANLPTAPMGDLLLAVDGGSEKKPTGTPTPRSAAWTTLLSSHPDTPTRAQALKTGTTPACS